MHTIYVLHVHRHIQEMLLVWLSSFHFYLSFCNHLSSYGCKAQPYMTCTDHILCSNCNATTSHIQCQPKPKLAYFLNMYFYCLQYCFPSHISPSSQVTVTLDVNVSLSLYISHTLHQYLFVLFIRNLSQNWQKHVCTYTFWISMQNLSIDNPIN